MSWYESGNELSDKQKKYVQLLENIWQMKTPTGEPIPYEMTEYQKEYHAKSINILGSEANHILWNKARGISFTFSSLVELLMTAISFEGQEIPLISHREKGSFKILDNAKWLVNNCRLKEVRDSAHFTDKSSFITFNSTGSTIQVYPSSAAADAVRSTRLIRGLIDEFAFQRNGHALWTAAKETMQSDMGQWIIGSTPNGRQNKFFDLVDKSRKMDIGIDLMELPVFNPEVFDVDKPIPEQDVEPIAPWISAKKLEDKRKEDAQSFLQENMCDFLDESASLIPYQSIINVTRSNLHNYHEDFARGHFEYETENPMLFGVDVAEKNDYFAVAGFEVVDTSDGERFFVQRYLDYFTNIEHTEMEQYLRNILEGFPTIVDMKIDSTGMGGFLPNYLQKDYRFKVTGVNFGKKIKTSQSKFKIRTRDAMSYGLQKLVEKKQVFLLNEQNQINHLNAMSRGLDMQTERMKGHGDIFFAVALALMQNTKTIRESEKMSFSRVDSDIRSPSKREIVVGKETLGQKLRKYQRK